MTKALAPFADFVVLATPDARADAAVQARDELSAAGAPEVLLVDGAKQAA
jgi:F420-dependent methylenetetrahydromethanopterin dehydrogenase